MNMQPRLDYQQASPRGVQAMLQLERCVRESGLDPKLLELIKTRASQMNGCGYCIDTTPKTHAPTEKPNSGCSP
jgi:alkylhydroperoxidase family enzyme